jgi:PPOX class probable F420-dependent enzyme
VRIVATLDDVRRIGARGQHLAVVATARADGSVQASLVNAAVIEHPVTGAPVVAFVNHGARKRANLRARPRATLTFRNGWTWVTVEGAVQLVGPDDPLPGVDPERLRVLLREIFTAAGGTHDDWDEYDRVMHEQRRAVVLVEPIRIYSNKS